MVPDKTRAVFLSGRWIDTKPPRPINLWESTIEMNCMPFARNHSTLYAGIAIALFASAASTSVSAQQADGTPAPTGQATLQATDLDAVTVTGYRYAIEKVWSKSATPTPWSM